MYTECRVPKNTSRCDGVVLCVYLQYVHRVQSTDEHVMVCGVVLCVYLQYVHTECRVPKNTSRCDGVVLCVYLQYVHRV